MYEYLTVKIGIVKVFTCNTVIRNIFMIILALQQTHVEDNSNQMI